MKSFSRADAADLNGVTGSDEYGETTVPLFSQIRKLAAPECLGNTEVDRLNVWAICQAVTITKGIVRSIPVVVLVKFKVAFPPDTENEGFEIAQGTAVFEFQVLIIPLSSKPSTEMRPMSDEDARTALVPIIPGFTFVPKASQPLTSFLVNDMVIVESELRRERIRSGFRRVELGRRKLTYLKTNENAIPGRRLIVLGSLTPTGGGGGGAAATGDEDAIPAAIAIMFPPASSETYKHSP
jgi:hypothetical protein